jgi:DNA-binding response OmpR family regulator
MPVRVAVVDDETDIGMTVAVALKVAGYEVVMFPDRLWCKFFEDQTSWNIRPWTNPLRGSHVI